MNKNVLIGIVVVAALATFWALKPAPVVVPQVGSVASPDFMTDWIRVGGVQHVFRSKALGTSTTTPCSFVSPAATSTLRHASLSISTASSTATTWTLARATTPYATTTLEVAAFTLGSGTLNTFIANASSTPVSPNTYLVWGLAGLNGSFDATKLNGVCNAEFTVDSF